MRSPFRVKAGVRASLQSSVEKRRFGREVAQSYLGCMLDQFNSTIRELVLNTESDNEPEDAASAAAIEFIEMLNDLAGNHAMALSGIAITQQSLSAVKLKNQTDESMNLVGYTDESTGQSIYWQRWQLNQIPDLLDPDGPVFRSIGQQWVVTLVAQWNEHFRQLFADALGLKVEQVVDPAMGDMNKLRNDILHHRGIATDRNAGRCQQRWFEPGEPIHVMPVHIVQLMDYFGRVKLRDDFDGGGPWDGYNVHLTPQEPE